MAPIWKFFWTPLTNALRNFSLQWRAFSTNYRKFGLEFAEDPIYASTNGVNTKRFSPQFYEKEPINKRLLTKKTRKKIEKPKSQTELETKREKTLPFLILLSPLSRDSILTPILSYLYKSWRSSLGFLVDCLGFCGSMGAAESPEVAGGTATAVAFEFPADGHTTATLSSAPVKIPRRIRKRLLEAKSGSSPPSSVEEIEARLREADLRRQVSAFFLSGKYYDFSVVSYFIEVLI